MAKELTIWHKIIELQIITQQLLDTISLTLQIWELEQSKEYQHATFHCDQTCD